jgi:putative flavoprotein involved in K+ transport
MNRLIPTAAAALIEEGAAFTELEPFARTSRSRRDRTAAEMTRERIPVVVIGGGQAGLSVGYHLARRRLPFVILDASRRVGDAWRNRWDSLRLFTPARFDGLDGMKFPAPPESFPSKDAMADYLEDYARRFQLPVRLGARVERVRRDGTDYLVDASDGSRIRARHVVVAMGSYQVPRTPDFASELDRDIVQLHSSAYRNPGQLAAGDVLLVGGGNSGAEIARELSLAGHKVAMAGPDTGTIPVRPGTFVARLVLPVIFRVIGKHILTTGTPIGRAIRPKILSSAAPLIRVKPRDLVALSVERLPRVIGIRDGRPLLEDGRTVDVPNVIWCTGYSTDFSWIDGVEFDRHGHPPHHRGIVEDEPGLYFVGLEFLYAFSSEMVQGVGRDARYVVDRIARRMRSPAEIGSELGQR